MEKNQRALRIKAFLEKDCELAGYRLEDMVTDASVRRYFRVVRADGSTAVLMDDESPYTKIREFVKIDSLLRGIGVRAPEILAQKTEEGFLLLEDFGDKDFAAVLDGRNDAAVFKLAVDALLKIYKDARRPDYVKDMDDAFIVKDFRLFLDWYMPAVLGMGSATGSDASFWTSSPVCCRWAQKFRRRWCCGIIMSTTSCCFRTATNAALLIFRTQCGGRRCMTWPA